jgi:hypothetical protein
VEGPQDAAPPLERTLIVLVTGAELEVDASVDEVIKALENAARSSAGTLAKLPDSGSGKLIALNAAQVVLVRSSKT